MRVQGDIETLIANCAKAEAPYANQFFNGWIGGASNIRFEHTGNIGWSGSTAISQAAAAINSVIMQSKAGLERFEVSSGNALDAILGILKYNPNSDSAGQNCIYASQGAATVNVDGPVSIAQFVKASANGHAVAVTGVNDRNSPIVGIALSTPSDRKCLVKLQGLH